MFKCPVCGGRVRRLDLRRQSFSCPWCKEKLCWSDGFSRLEFSIFGAVLVFGPFVIAAWLWPGENAPWLGGVLCLVLAFPFSFLYGVLRFIFYPPRLRRDSGWPDEGTILHITGPPGPPNEQ
jgi:hypothetical protein